MAQPAPCRPQGRPECQSPRHGRESSTSPTFCPNGLQGVCVANSPSSCPLENVGTQEYTGTPWYLPHRSYSESANVPREPVDGGACHDGVAIDRSGKLTNSDRTKTPYVTAGACPLRIGYASYVQYIGLPLAPAQIMRTPAAYLGLRCRQRVAVHPRLGYSARRSKGVKCSYYRRRLGCLVGFYLINDGELGSGVHQPFAIAYHVTLVASRGHKCRTPLCPVRCVFMGHDYPGDFLPM